MGDVRFVWRWVRGCSEVRQVLENGESKHSYGRLQDVISNFFPITLKSQQFIPCVH